MKTFGLLKKRFFSKFKQIFLMCLFKKPPYFFCDLPICTDLLLSENYFSFYITKQR